MHRWHGRGLAMEMKNDAAPWDRLISTDHELELPRGEGGRSFVNFKN